MEDVNNQWELTDAEGLGTLLEQRVDHLLGFGLLHGQWRRSDLLADDLLLGLQNNEDHNVYILQVTLKFYFFNSRGTSQHVPKRFPNQIL